MTPDVHRTPGRGFAPESILGRWSVGFFLAFVAALLVFAVIAVSGAGTWDEGAFFGNLELTIPLLIAAASAVWPRWCSRSWPCWSAATARPPWSWWWPSPGW